MSGTNRYRRVLLGADFAHLLNGGFPCPGFPDAVDQPPVGVDQLTGSVPAQLIKAKENFALKTGLGQRTLNKLRVVVLFQILVLHDVDEGPRPAVFPRPRQLIEQTFRRIVAGAVVALLQPLFEDQPAFGMAGSGISIVLVHLQPALVHAKIHAPGDHMMTAALPREAQTRPENFRNIEQRQQVVILHHLIGGVQIHQVQLVGGFDQLLFGTFADGEILIGILVDEMTVGCHVGFLQRVFLVQPFTAKLAVVWQPRAFDGHRLARQHRLRQAVFGIGGLDHPA